MKKLFILLLLTFSIQNALAQACGIYYVKYVGNLDAEGFNVETVEIPNIPFFYGLDELDEEGTLFPVTPESNSFHLQIQSHLTSPMSSAEAVLRLYESKRESIPIVITLNKNGIRKEIQLNLSWKDIQITEIEKKDGFPRFEFNLGTLKL